MDTSLVVAVLVNLVVSAVAIGLLMAVCLILSVRLKQWSFIDTLWGLGFVLVAIVSFSIAGGSGHPQRKAAMLLVTALWGIRLATHLFRRSRSVGEDPRYTAHMRRRQGSVVGHAVRTILWPQARIMWFVSIPIQLAMYENAAMDILAWGGVGLALVGITFETVADLQLSRFKADPRDRSAIMDRGLWSWTRHPNYFGDSCVMFGLWAISCGHWVGFLAVACPAYMTHRLVNRNGKALLERRMSRSRGPAYAEYVARTSGFIPRPPRRSKAVPTAN